jgi:hypothetical protein
MSYVNWILHLEFCTEMLFHIVSYLKQYPITIVYYDTTITSEVCNSLKTSSVTFDLRSP